MVEITAGTNQFAGAIAFIGGFVLVFGLFSFFIKQKLFLADSLVTTCVGILIGPLIIGLVDPYAWPSDIDTITLSFSDLVINIQVCPFYLVSVSYKSK